MAKLHEFRNGWHPGEQEVHKMLRIFPQRENPTSQGLPMSYGYRVATSHLVAFGALDDRGRPWTTIWGGEHGFARPVAQGVLGVQNLVDRRYDPVVQALLGGAKDGELVQPGGGGADGGARRQGTMMSGLSIDLESRDRVKLAGRMIVGAVSTKADDGSDDSDGSGSGKVGEVQLAMGVEESLGNCPKYINKKDIRPHVPNPELVSDTLPLPAGALHVIEQADMIFLSSTNGETMDTNHRGGPQGFVRIISNRAEADGGVSIVYPEYSGNRLYQSLGNLVLNPRIGLAIPDYDTGDVLYLTGAVRILVGSDAAALLPHSKVAVRIAVEEARFVRDGLPFRGPAGERSPYNPPVRPLASEQEGLGLPDALRESGAVAVATARLVGREVLSPTVARFRFAVQRPAASSSSSSLPPVWKAGQHVTLDFSGELDIGYSHMRDDDPTSLNDDFVRTFTVSNQPPPATAGEDDGAGGMADGTELEITARRHGPATALLWKQNLRAPLEIPVVGFAGEAAFRLPLLPDGDDDDAAAASEPPPAQSVFVAGGVGITPLLAQAPEVLARLARAGKPAKDALALLWSIKAEDVPLALDTFRRIPGLAETTRLFVTGKSGDKVEKLVEEAEREGAEVTRRRMEKGDLLLSSERKRKYFVCASPEMLKVAVRWLDAEDVVFESFNY